MYRFPCFYLAISWGKLQPMGGGSPGLVVMGDDSCLKGRGFESWRSILDGLLDMILY